MCDGSIDQKSVCTDSKLFVLGHQQLSRKVSLRQRETCVPSLQLIDSRLHPLIRISQHHLDCSRRANATVSLSTFLIHQLHFKAASQAYSKYMWPTATGVECSVGCVSVCVLVTRMCCTKTDEPIERPFGGWLTWAQGKMYYMGSKSPHGKGQFWGLTSSVISMLHCM